MYNEKRREETRREERETNAKEERGTVVREAKVTIEPTSEVHVAPSKSTLGTTSPDKKYSRAAVRKNLCSLEGLLLSIAP